MCVCVCNYHHYKHCIPPVCADMVEDSGGPVLVTETTNKQHSLNRIKSKQGNSLVFCYSEAFDAEQMK